MLWDGAPPLEADLQVRVPREGGDPVPLNKSQCEAPNRTPAFAGDTSVRSDNQRKGPPKSRPRPPNNQSPPVDASPERVNSFQNGSFRSAAIG